MNIPGSLKLFKDVFHDDEAVLTEAPVISINGRNPDLDKQRNECLLEVYFYKAQMNKLIGYQPLVKMVAAQFFLSPVRTAKIIDNNIEALQRLRTEWKDKPEEKLRKHFSGKWPHLVW